MFHSYNHKAFNYKVDRYTKTMREKIIGFYVNLLLIS